MVSERRLSWRRATDLINLSFRLRGQGGLPTRNHRDVDGTQAATTVADHAAGMSLGLMEDSDSHSTRWSIESTNATRHRQR